MDKQTEIEVPKEEVNRIVVPCTNERCSCETVILRRGLDPNYFVGKCDLCGLTIAKKYN